MSICEVNVNNTRLNNDYSPSSKNKNITSNNIGTITGSNNANVEIFVSKPPHVVLRKRCSEIFDFDYFHEQDFELEDLYELFLETLAEAGMEKEFNKIYFHYNAYKNGPYYPDWFDFIDKTDTPLGECYFWGELNKNINEVICIRIY